MDEVVCRKGAPPNCPSVRRKYTWEIYATDIAQELVEVLEKDTQAHGWPVKTAIMPAQELTFAENTFTHSIMNCVILRLSDTDATKACSEMFRTLRPGGVAMVSGWADVPHRMPMLAAHNATREPNSEALVGGAIRWVDGTLLRSSMEKGGFKDVKMWKARSVSEIEDLGVWVEYMWSVLGRMQSGWVPNDEKHWGQALKVFGDSLKNEPGVELLENGKARLTSWCWIAMAEK
ncbi:hypothetical protein ACMFMG_010738 [Clarireedia jacksonii]